MSPSSPLAASRTAYQPQEANPDRAPAGFLRLVNAQVDAARAALESAIALPLKSLDGELGDASTFVHIWRQMLDARLITLVARTCVLELHVARLQNHLAGDTPADRFASFIERLERPETAAQLWQEYPVLHEQVASCLKQWVEFGQEFVARLVADWPRLKAAFLGAKNPGPMMRIEGGVGDRHRDGRSVLIIHFRSGQRLVYKPRPMAVEDRFAALTDWLNVRGAEPQLRPLRVLDRGDYGWAEFVAAKDCTSRADVERFYRRQGMYLAILALLSATDFHFENLIACGEHPVLIDLEALFHRRLPGSPNEPTSAGLAHSVHAVRMLPNVHYVDGLPDPIDFSGLGAIPGQPTPFAAPAWVGADADTLRLEHRAAPLSDGKHRPVLDGESPPLTEYQTAVLRGFQAMYALLGREREALLDPSGPLAAFAETEVRFIARPTQSYAILLDQSLHPDRLRDPLARRQLFDRLSNRAERVPCLQRLLDAELDDLNRHDVPMFTTRPASRHLWSSRGERFENFFSHTGLELVYERLRRLGPDDLARQTWLIQASFATLPGQPVAAIERLQVFDSNVAAEIQRFIPAPSSPQLASPLTHEAPQQAWPQAAARARGERLRQLAWHYVRDAEWLVLQPRERGWVIAPIGLGTRDGLAASVRFLAALAQLTKDAPYRRLAVKAASSLLRRM